MKNYYYIKNNFKTLKDFISLRSDNEYIHFYSLDSFYNSDIDIYIETNLNSNLDNAIKKHSYRLLSINEFNKSINLDLTEYIFDKIGKKGNIENKILIIMSGIPLTGKTTLSNMLKNKINAIHIENDDIRNYIVNYYNYDKPLYNKYENLKTYTTSWELIRYSLKNKNNVIFDGTNLTERGRLGAYEAAYEYNSKIIVIFLKNDKNVLENRYNNVDELRKRAYKKLRKQRYVLKYCSVPYIEIDQSEINNDNVNDLIKSICNKLDLKIP